MVYPWEHLDCPKEIKKQFSSLSAYSSSETGFFQCLVFLSVFTHAGTGAAYLRVISVEERWAVSVFFM